LYLEIAAPDVTISMLATTTQIDGPHVGLRCASIDLESITHLQRLVELDSGDPAILDREFASLVRAGRSTANSRQWRHDDSGRPARLPAAQGH
jgi:hypothetical protein